MPAFEVDPDGSIVVAVHVQPGAARAGVAGWYGDALKLKVSAPPERGRANDAVARLLAAELDLRPGDVEIASGHGSRRKRVRVRGVDAGRFAAWLPPRPAG